VESLCDEVIWLESGMAREIGPAADIIESYLKWADSPDA
jgi:ABC-type polysaccharide/polyol phosphate transport system ATPase subunit